MADDSQQQIAPQKGLLTEMMCVAPRWYRMLFFISSVLALAETIVLVWGVFCQSCVSGSLLMSIPGSLQWLGVVGVLSSVVLVGAQAVDGLRSRDVIALFLLVPFGSVAAAVVGAVWHDVIAQPHPSHYIVLLATGWFVGVVTHRTRLAQVIRRWWLPVLVTLSTVLLVFSFLVRIMALEIGSLGEALFLLLLFVPVAVWGVQDCAADYTGKRQVQEKKRVTDLAREQASWLVWLLVLVSVAFGVWLRVAAVDTFDFQNDEFYHVDTAIGYLKTGEYVKWKHLQDEAGASYIRAWPYTWQVAQSVKYFGTSEKAMRLPALAWGVLLLLLVPLFTYYWTRSSIAAVAACLLTSFDDGLIWSSITNRMYSMFIVGALLTVWCFFMAVQSRASSFQTRVMWLFTALIIGGFNAYYIHPVGYLLFFGFGVAAVVLLFRDWPNAFYRLLVAGLAVAITAIAVIQPLTGLFPLDFIAVRSNLALQYVTHPVKNTVLVLAAMALAVVPLAAARLSDRSRSILPILYSVLVPIIIFFVYFADRYTARKYELFIVPIVFFVIAAGWGELWRRTMITQRARLLLATLFFVMLFTPVMIPGVTEYAPLLPVARADRTYDDMDFHAYREGYATLEKRVAPNDFVFILLPREYYLSRKDLQYVRIPPRQNFSAVDFRTYLQKDNTPIWVVYPRYKSYHISQNVKEVLETEFMYMSEFERYNLFVFYKNVEQ